MLFKPKKKYVEKRRKVINHNRVLHAEIQESEINVQPTCNAILEESGAGFYHSCVFYETVGTQTDEPKDVSEEKCQEFYFVVYICLIFNNNNNNLFRYFHIYTWHYLMQTRKLYSCVNF